MWYAFFFFFFYEKQTHTHTRERERDSNTKAHHNSTQKLAMVTFKGGWGKLYYIQYTLSNNVGQLPILFLRNKHTHTQGRGKEVLT